MARTPKLRARFFAPASGPAIEKAKPITPKRRRELFVERGGRCEYCDRPLRLRRYPWGWLTMDTDCANIDHIFPRCRGGQNEDENLLLTCEHCNFSKGAA